MLHPPSKKTGIMVHLYLPMTASSKSTMAKLICPQVTDVKRFACNANHKKFMSSVKLTSTELKILEELSIHCW